MLTLLSVIYRSAILILFFIARILSSCSPFEGKSCRPVYTHASGALASAAAVVWVVREFIDNIWWIFVYGEDGIPDMYPE